MGKEGRIMNFYSDVFEPVVERSPDNTALSFEGKSYTYRELDGAVRAYAAILQNATQPNDRVCLLLPNIPQLVIAYLALHRIERIAVPCNPSLVVPEIIHIINETVSRIIITTEATCSSGQIPRANDMLSVSELFSARDSADNHIAVPHRLSYLLRRNARFSADNANNYNIKPVPPYAATILYTSGTTGKPIGAILTQRNIIMNGRAAAYYTGMTEQDRVICFLPLFHSFGLIFVMGACFSAGAELLLFRKWSEDVLPAAKENRATIFPSTPPTYHQLINNAREARPYLASVRYFFSMSSTLPEKLNRSWEQEFGIPIFQGYGLAEAPFVTENCSPVRYRKGSVGRAIRNVAVTIVDPKTKAILPRGPEHVGEICIRGKNIMYGYWMRPYESAVALVDNWLHTGDAGWMDDDGYLYYFDRYENLIHDAELEIWPREVENVLRGHGGVKEAAVIGLPHPERGEIAVACIIPTDAQRALIGNDNMQWTYWAGELKEFCMKYLAPYKIPREFLPATEFPKSPAGKILKRVMRKEVNREV